LPPLDPPADEDDEDPEDDEDEPFEEPEDDPESVPEDDEDESALAGLPAVPPAGVSAPDERESVR
jgi:hypothetical protein